MTFQTGLATNLNADLNELTGRVKLIAWPNTSPDVVPDVQATWESLCANRAATQGCKLSTGTVLNVATDSLGYLCGAKGWLCGSALLVVHPTKTFLCCDLARWLAMLQNVILLIFTALASSFLWWRARFKVCRRCRSRIRRWASVCHVCGAEQ